MNNLLRLLKATLIEILSSRVRINKVKEFQNIVWTDHTIDNEDINDVISEIAYDLDFYEPNEVWRQEDISFYGDTELDRIVKSAIVKIDKLLNSNTIKY